MFTRYAYKEIASAEWDVIEICLSETRYSKIAGILRARNNKPIHARALLQESDIESSLNEINDLLRKRSPFRLSFIASIVKEEPTSQQLAFSKSVDTS